MLVGCASALRSYRPKRFWTPTLK